MDETEQGSDFPEWINPPFCLVTCAGPRIVEELELLVSSFRRHNPGIPIVCVGEGMEADCARLGLAWVDYPPGWDFKSDCGRMRCLALREGLQRARWALYADCDVIFTAPFPALEKGGAGGVQVLLSEHYVDAATAAKYGRYNSGYIATCDPAFCDWWPEFTAKHPELFCEQQPLECAPRHFRCGVFNAGHNVGFWRMACQPLGFETRWTRDNRWDGWPVISVHGHLKNYGGRPGQGYNFYPPFADLVRKRVLLSSLKRGSERGSSPRLVLYVPWYRASDPARQAEIDEATRRNLAAGADEVVILLEEKDRGAGLPAEVFPAKLALHVETTHGRQTFADVYALAAKQPGSIAVWINSDCYFAPGALDALRAREWSAQSFVCISRWDGDVLNGTAWGSQDAWALLGDPALVGQDTDLAFGTPNIDHVVNARMQSRGYDLFNPCHEVRVQHLHAGGARSYPPQLTGPVLFVWPEENGRSRCSSQMPVARWDPHPPRNVHFKDANGRWKVGVA
jgi:hypothetical protein